MATYEGESTDPIDICSASLYDLQKALNELTTITAAGGVTVHPLVPPYQQLAPLPATVNDRRIRDNFIVSFDTVGVKSALTLSVTSLRPENLEATTIVLRTGDANHTHRVALTTTGKPIATAVLDSALATPSITTSEVTAGIGGVHAVHAVTIDPMPFPGDEWSITVAGGTETRWLSINASGEDLSRALNEANNTTGYNAWRMDQSVWHFRYPTAGNKALGDVRGIFAASSGSERDLQWEADLEVYETLTNGFDANLILSVSEASGSVIRREAEKIRILV